MVRYTKQQSQAIARCIHDANIANFSVEGTIQYIKDKVHVPIARTALYNRRRILRNDSIKVWNKYRSDDYQLRLEYLDRIKEVKRAKESCFRKMLEYENNPKTFFQWKIACGMFLDANKQLTELVSFIPEIDAIGHLTGEEDEKISGLPTAINTGTSEKTRNPEAIF